MTDSLKEREAFEAFFSDHGKWPAAVERSGEGYKLAAAQSAWVTWQACCAAIDAALAARGAVPAGWATVPRHKIVDAGFRWDGEKQVHVPLLVIEFDEAQVGTPNDAGGWADRDRMALMLSATPQQVAQPRDPEDGAAHAAWTSHATNWKEKFTTLDHQSTFFAGWIACRTALASYPPVAQAKPEQAAQQPETLRSAYSLSRQRPPLYSDDEMFHPNDD